MRIFTILNGFVHAALLALLMTAVPVLAAGDTLDALFERLADPDNPDWQLAESDILREWSKSGSPAMDLLLQRGEQAMAEGDLVGAIDHFTALTDHAPDFAEGWNARATAFFLAGQFGPSVADIRRTLALNPRHFGALGGLARILEETGDSTGAMAAYRAALSIHPHLEGLKQALERLEQEASGTDI